VAAEGAADGATGRRLQRLQGVLLAKLRQLPPSLPNVLALVAGEGAAVTGTDVAAAAKQLAQVAGRKEEPVFTRRGYESARDFLGYLARLSGVLVAAGSPDAPGLREGLEEGPGEGLQDVSFWPNPQARHAIPRDAVVAMARSAQARR
jgi:hypothetical protein